MLNDLWKYCVSSNQWTWESGDTIQNPLGNWGTLGVTSPSNKPNGRDGAVGWADNKGHLYFRGGVSLGVATAYNDLWKFTIDSTCSTCAAMAPCALSPIASFQSAKTDICANDCINFTDLSTNNPTNWQWSFQGGIPTSSTNQNPQNICYQISGTYNVTLIASNGIGSDSVTFTNYLTVNPAPPTPVINQIGTTLYFSTNSSYTSYQWYIDTTLIKGATDTLLVITHGGNYNVKVSDENGCSIAVGITVGIKEFTQSNYISLSPNPATDELLISGNWQSASGKKIITIYNILGETIYVKELNNKPETVNCKSLPAGIYFAQIASESGRLVGKFVKE